MLLALGAIALVGLGALFAWLLVHDRSNAQTGTTVVITTQPATSATRTTAGAPAVPRKLVPDLSGLKLAAARERLSALGLRAAVTAVTTSAAPPGSIVDQAPKGGGRLPRGSTVTLSVATAPSTTTAAATTTTTTPTTTAASTTAPKAAAPSPQSATVPDVQGEKEASAVQRLGQAGILASLAFVPGSDPLGTVLQQAKPSGTVVPYHAHVQINISRGPADNSLEQVPNVIGKQPPGCRLGAAGRETALDLPQVPRHLTGPGRQDRSAVAALRRTGARECRDPGVPRRVPTYRLS